MKIKRIISILLCSVILISLVLNANIFANAETNPTVYSDMSGSTVNAGETIRVPISMKDNNGLMGWMLTFNYDTDVLTPISVDYGDVISGGIQDSIEGNAVPGSFNVYWAGSENEYYDGVMIYINFRVDSKAVGNTTIEIVFSQADTFDGDFDDVYLNCQNINLSIENSGYSQYAKINAHTDDVMAGEYLEIKLNISEINNVSNIDLSISYNAQTFSFVSVAANGASLTSKDSNGNVVLSVSNITSALNNTDFVTIKFKCKDKAMAGSYDFAVSSTDSGIICKGCRINVIPSATSEIAEIYADEVTANYGETFTIPVQIENNHGIMGYRMHFEYDPTQLEMVLTSNGDGFGGNFNDNHELKAGEFDVLWNNSEDVIKDGTLLNLTFKVLTNEKVTSTIKVSYSQSDTFNESWADVVFNCKDISVDLNQITEPDLTNFVITTVSLSLESSITMNFKVLKTAVADYDNPYVIFECNSKKTKVTEYTEQGNYFVFSFPGISPQMMGDTVSAKLYATYKANGKEYESNSRAISVKDYVFKLLPSCTPQSYSKLRTLLVDLLNYGAAAQVYMNYKTNSLVNSDLTAEQKSWGTSTTPTLSNITNRNYKTINNPTVNWSSAGLVLNNSVMIRAGFTASDIENKSVKITCNGRTFTYTKADTENIVPNGNGSYYVYCDELYANEMSKEILLTVYESGVQCSNTMRFSIESYAKSIHDSAYAGTALDNLTQAMMRYGKSAEAYKA